MKKLAIVIVLAFAAVAVAKDVIQASFIQVGNGANGMTSAAPALATDGVATQSSNFSISTRCNATQAQLNLQLQIGSFSSSAFQAWERGWIYTVSPDAGSSTGAYSWQQYPAMDWQIDAGSVAAKGGSTLSTVIQLPALPNGARVAWTAEQVQQTGTLDAGANLGVTLFAPSSCDAP